MELYTNGNVQVGGGPDGHYDQYEQDAREGTNPGVVDPVQSSWLHFGLLDYGQGQITVPSQREYIKKLAISDSSLTPLKSCDLRGHRETLFEPGRRMELLDISFEFLFIGSATSAIYTGSHFVPMYSLIWTPPTVKLSKDPAVKPATRQSTNGLITVVWQVQLATCRAFVSRRG